MTLTKSTNYSFIYRISDSLKKFAEVGHMISKTCDIILYFVHEYYLQETVKTKLSKDSEPVFI